MADTKFGEPKAFASLTAGLLARKGGAKPAMRPQLYNAQDDLGWNDMGDPPAPTPIKAVPVPIAFGQPVAEEPVPPPVVVQQVALAQSFAPTNESTPPRAAPGAKGKSAFTLRLDEARHLRLRLMGAHRHRSAQSLVTEALDRFLDDFDSGRV